MTALSFSKMQGCGNDFVLIDALSSPLHVTPEWVSALAHRQWGVGCDQVLVVEAPSHPEADFRYRIFNADGSEVQHCGNGARCFLRFVRQKGLTRKRMVKAEIARGLITLSEDEAGHIQVEMGGFSQDPDTLPFVPSPEIAGTRQLVGTQTFYTLPLPEGEHSAPFALLSIGNPHAVRQVEDVSSHPVAQEGAFVGALPCFPEGVNVGFMQILNPQTIRLRVVERGCGETLACGTGACAAALSGLLSGRLRSPVQVQMPGGTLHVALKDNQLWLSGEAVTVYEGHIADMESWVEDVQKRLKSPLYSTITHVSAPCHPAQERA